MHRHRQHLNHGAVDALNVIVAVGVVGAAAILRMPRTLYTASDSLERNSSPLSEMKLAAQPERGMYFVTKDISGAFSSKFHNRDGAHVCAIVEAIRAQ